MINRLMRALVAELKAEGIADPLGESFSLSSVWSDLARLDGEPLPPGVAARLDAPIDAVPAAVAAARWVPEFTREPAEAPA